MVPRPTTRTRTRSVVEMDTEDMARSGPSVNDAPHIVTPGAVGGRAALDPGFEHPQIVVEMHEACEMARRDAAKVVVAPEKRRRNARCHCECVAKIEPNDVDDVTHGFVHCQDGSRQRAIVKPQAAVRGSHAAALQVELI